MFRQWRKVVVLISILSLLLPIGASALSKSEYAKQLPYWVEVDLTHNLVIAYSTKDDSIVRIMICSPGLEYGSTPTGTYYLPQKEKSEERTPWYKMDGSWVRYATRVYMGIMTHSILYRRTDITSLYQDTWELLGSNASHGCIRLTPLDAQWIAYNCETGTKFVFHRVEKSTQRKEKHDELKAALAKPGADGTLGIWEATLSPTPPPLMQQGSTSYHIESLQQRLKSIGYFTDKINGKYEESTALAIMNFQDAMGYEPTGTINSEILELIYDPNSAIGTYVTIVKKDSGVVVRKIQEKLTELGYYSGSFTGTYDENTRDAMWKFCRDNNLSVSDELIPSVQAKIFAAGDTPEVQRTPRPSSGSAPAPTPAPTEVIESKHGLSSGDSARVVLDKDGSTLNLRATESTDSTILAKIPHEALIDILEPGEKYHQILYHGIEGYASAKYIVPNT